MTSEKVRKEIDCARRFGEQLEKLVASKNQLPGGDRNTLLIAYWALMFDYHKGILILLESEFSGAAFALVRPVMEAVVRAHVTLMGSEEDLLKIQKDEYKVNFKEVGAKIDTAFGLEGLMKNFLNEVTRAALHSYTHSGLLQLGRRFHGDDVKPNYSDEEIIEVIWVTTSAAFMVTSLMTKHFGFEQDWENVSQMYDEWGKHT